MTPAARLQAVIDVLSEIDDSTNPADRILRAYFRKRRYAGSRDRRAVGDQVYRILRRRGLLDFALNGAGDARSRALLDAAETGNLQDVADMLVAGGQYGPAPLSVQEQDALAQALERLASGEVPDWAEANIPEWLADYLKSALGDGWRNQLPEPDQRASVDLRVNSARSNRDRVLSRLRADGIEAEAFGWTENTIRVTGNPDLSNHAAYRDGWFEIQDAGSQLVAALVDARPGMLVADVCAGAGGKTLALADQMAGEGILHALDIGKIRLDQLEKRARRAEVENIERAVADMSRSAPDDLIARMDRVLVDAPCTGTGTWRRNPENRWRLQPDIIDDYCRLQKEILLNAAKLVSSGGRLIYATCSVLPAENVTAITEFLTAHQEFQLISIDEVLSGSPTAGAIQVERLDDLGKVDSLALNTGTHQTDGFYAAVLERD